MDKIMPVFKAFIPFLFLSLGALGVELSPELKTMVEENLTAILIAVGGLVTAFPSIRAAMKFGKDAK